MKKPKIGVLTGIILIIALIAAGLVIPMLVLTKNEELVLQSKRYYAYESPEIGFVYGDAQADLEPNAGAEDQIKAQAIENSLMILINAYIDAGILPGFDTLEMSMEEINLWKKGNWNVFSAILVESRGDYSINIEMIDTFDCPLSFTFSSWNSDTDLDIWDILSKYVEYYGYVGSIEQTGERQFRFLMKDESFSITAESYEYSNEKGFMLARN